MLTFELRWAEAIARCMVPRGALGGSMDEKDLPVLFAQDCAESPWYANLVLRLSLWLTWLSPLWMTGRLRTFGSLGGPEREALLERLLVSPLHLVRLTMLYFKLISLSLLMGDRKVLARLGAYDLAPATEAQIQPLQLLQLGERAPAQAAAMAEEPGRRAVRS